jgi:hypothetical protein
MTPKTVRENIISIQGHITGVKKDIDSIKNNHLKHLHDDVMSIHGKLDRYVNAFIGCVSCKEFHSFAQAMHTSIGDTIVFAVDEVIYWHKFDRYCE